MNQFFHYFQEYESYHRTNGNKRCHYLGIPMITVTTLGLLAQVYVLSSPVNIGMCLLIVAMAWYFTLDRKIALSFMVPGIACYVIGRTLPLPWLWTIFVLGWILQFIGHYYYEKRSPAFTDNIVHLLIGPLWIFCHACKKKSLSIYLALLFCVSAGVLAASCKSCSQTASNNTSSTSSTNTGSTSSTTSSNATSPMGTNIRAIREWSPEYTFVDAFKASKHWMTQCTLKAPTKSTCTASNQSDTNEESLLQLDASGWVTSLPSVNSTTQTYWLVGTIMMDSLNGNYPGGQYIVLYDGTGSIVYGGDAVQDTTKSALHRDVLNVTPANAGITLQIQSTDPNGTGDYIRNIHVIMPGFEQTYATQVFHPDFLAKIANFHTLRFKDWMETDGSTQVDWTSSSSSPGRPLPSDARWTGGNGTNNKGVPVEIMAQLANKNGSDAWFNMPHQATDNYITQFATLAQQTMASTANIYVEYSNETWNSVPPFNVQTTYVQDQGAALWNTSDPNFTKGINWSGLRSAQMCDIWKSVWGSQASRVRCVIAMQSDNPWTGKTAMDCKLWTAGTPCYAHGISSLAIAPYFGGYLGNTTNQTQVSTWPSLADGGLGNIFQEINSGGVITGGPAGGALQQEYNSITTNLNNATTRGLTLVTYEGGQSLVVGGYTDSAVTAMFNTANRDARMGTVYSNYLAQWKTLGGHLFVHFNNVDVYNQYGSWGLLEYLSQTSTPKWDNVQSFISNNSCWWTACP